MGPEVTSPSSQWTTLQGQWQALGQQWAHWWTQTTGSLPATNLPFSGSGLSAIALPTLPAAWIDPTAAAALTELFKTKLEALWLRTLQGTPKDAAVTHRDPRFATREWREQPYF